MVALPWVYSYQVVSRVGADVTRLSILFKAPPEKEVRRMLPCAFSLPLASLRFSQKFGGAFACILEYSRTGRSLYGFVSAVYTTLLR